MVIVILVIIVLAVIVGLIAVSLYNGFVQKRNRVDNAWAQVDVVLKRRYDLIPNLVETVKGYASHERETFERVTAARTAAANASGVQQQGQAENMLTGALRQLFAVAEAYPELKANQNFQQLQTELTNTEGQIATARQIYNDTVLNYNNAIQVFPGVLIAGPFGFSPKTFLEMEEADRQVPRVDFGTSSTQTPPPPPPAPPATPTT